MRKNHINRAEMMDAVITYMDENIGVWSPVPIIGAFLGELKEVLGEISEHKEAQQAAKVFIQNNKKEQKKYVARKADILNDSLFAYAGVVENVVLENKSDKSYTDFYKLANANFITEIKETIELLEDHLADLKDYGVSKGQINDLKESFDNFLDLNGQPRQFRISSKVATESLDELFKKSTIVLEKKLDKVLTRYKNTNPTFYKGYQAARVVVDN